MVRQPAFPSIFDDPFFRRFFGNPNGFGGGSRVQNSLGSGVIVDPSGLVVTNAHVIDGADEIKVALSDRREFAAQIVLSDTRTDLAVLRIEAEGPYPALDFADSDELDRLRRLRDIPHHRPRPYPDELIKPKLNTNETTKPSC